jgi:uncharacterized protein
MFDRASLDRYLRGFQERPLPEAVERELSVPDTGRVLSIYGPRRCGKSYFLFQLMRGVLAGGIGMDRIIYLNFEDVRLSGLAFSDIEDVIRLQLELFPGAIGERLYVFVDEPQNVPGWERAVRSLHDRGTFALYITGSSAKLLSREISTSLRGRTLSYLLLPFSFKEFLLFGKIAVPARLVAGTDQEALLKSRLSEYLRIGGFPEVAGAGDDGTRVRILTDYYNLIVYRDIVERHGIENLSFLKFLLNQLFTAYSREMSAHRIFNTAKSRGFGVSKKTVYEYIGHIEDALAVFLLRRWARSPKTRETSLPKAYLSDTGFSMLFAPSSDDSSYLAENAVYLGLKRAQNVDALLELYYWKDRAGTCEVDFALRRRGKFIQLVQVSRSIDSPETLKRELRGLISAARELGCHDLTIVNWEREGFLESDGESIRLVPLWKWLLAHTLKPAPEGSR